MNAFTIAGSARRPWWARLMGLALGRGKKNADEITPRERLFWAVERDRDEGREIGRWR